MLSKNLWNWILTVLYFVCTINIIFQDCLRTRQQISQKRRGERRTSDGTGSVERVRGIIKIGCMNKETFLKGRIRFNFIILILKEEYGDESSQEKNQEKDASPSKEEEKSTNGRRSKKSLQTYSNNFDRLSSRNPLPKPKCRVTYRFCVQFSHDSVPNVAVIRNNSKPRV